MRTWHFIKALCLSLVVLAAFLAQGEQLFAQTSLQDITNAHIRLTPEYPSPGQIVTAVLDAYAYDTTGASIAWYVNGVEQSTYRNEREIRLTAGELGKTDTITARLVLANESTVTVEKSVTPIRTDLIVEADSYVPAHYKGRALPSVGSTMRAIALIDRGSNTNPNTLFYTWKVNDKSLYGGGTLGRSVATFITPMGRNVTVSVDIADETGTVIARKAVVVNPVEPEVLFYENNPLRGIAYNVLQSPHRLIADEITVRAEPYYMSNNIFSENPLIEWTVGGQEIENPSTDPQNITLRKSGTRGRFNVEFHIRNLSQLLQGVRDSFVVTF